MTPQDITRMEMDVDFQIISKEVKNAGANDELFMLLLSPEAHDIIMELVQLERDELGGKDIEIPVNMLVDGERKYYKKKTIAGYYKDTRVLTEWGYTEKKIRSVVMNDPLIEFIIANLIKKERYRFLKDVEFGGKILYFQGFNANQSAGKKTYVALQEKLGELYGGELDEINKKREEKDEKRRIIDFFDKKNMKLKLVSGVMEEKKK